MTQNTQAKLNVKAAKAARRVYNPEEVKASINRHTLKRTYNL